MGPHHLEYSQNDRGKDVSWMPGYQCKCSTLNEAHSHSVHASLTPPTTGQDSQSYHAPGMQKLGILLAANGMCLSLLLCQMGIQMLALHSYYKDKSDTGLTWIACGTQHLTMFSK